MRILVQILTVLLVSCQLALLASANTSKLNETEIVFSTNSGAENEMKKKETRAVVKNYEGFFNFMQQLTGLYFYPVISVFGIIGNCFMIVVYKESKKHSTNFYLIALSFSDIIKLVNDFMYFLVSLVTKIDPALGYSIYVTIYNYSHYVFIFSALNTSWLTCAIAFDRYFAIVGKQLRKQHVNYIHSIVVSLTIFVLSLVLAVPSPFFIQPTDVFDEKKNATVRTLIDTKLGKSDFKKVYQYFNALLRAVIPFLLLVYLNFRIIRVVYANKMKKKSNNKHSTTKSRVTLMLITIMLTFTICIFPDAIMTMMQLGYANESFLVRGIREITDLLLAINSAVPFPICYYFSIEFRRKFRTIFMTAANKSALNKKCINDSICPDHDENTVLVSQTCTRVNMVVKGAADEKRSVGVSTDKQLKPPAKAGKKELDAANALEEEEDNLSNLVL